MIQHAHSSADQPSVVEPMSAAGLPGRRPAAAWRIIILALGFGLVLAGAWILVLCVGSWGAIDLPVRLVAIPTGVVTSALGTVISMSQGRAGEVRRRGDT